ncbi:MAG TPA: hypothetical protein VI031_01095, partial [Pyrinomonadaceae bacterium]
MAKQLIVSVNGREKKIAIIEDDKVAEFYIERGEQHQGIVGNIYKGRVMRVLPGMQSAFVDIGLERDAFLYVSDFFDEEEEFERIVIDKTKKGAPDVEHAAAEELALNRVEREQQIEAVQERVEPLREQEQESAAPEEVPESQDGGRRRGRRGRRRGRWEKTDDATPVTPPPTTQFEIPDTPFVAGDPSIERIVDEEETAANGEMFKDARLQERLFDQIHAVEFNMGEDDFRSAEVGSLLSAGLGSDSFERIDDADADVEPIREERPPREAHVSSFVDDVASDTMRSVSFERVSDDDEEVAPEPVVEKQAGKRARKTPAAGKKRAAKTASKSSASKKKASSKKSSKKRTGDAESSEAAESIPAYADSEARVSEGQSRGEFATRRGGRRRRRPSKNRPSATGEVDGASQSASQSNGHDDEIEQVQFMEPQEEIPAPPVAEPTPRPRQREQRDQREPRGRDQRSYRGQSRRERHQPAITDLLSEGQEILVQIAKEPIAKKGARITSHIALPGRFLV